MKVLFAASRPSGGRSLKLEREIVDLQQRFAASSGEPVSFRFLPNLRAESLASEVAKFGPDVLHVSAHGSRDALSFSNERNAEVAMTSAVLGSLLRVAPPKLVYLNACNSAPIARALSADIPVTIGTVAPITNDTACTSAVLFYDCLLQGKSIQAAYEISSSIIECLSNQGTKSKLYKHRGVKPDKLFLHAVPRVVARFTNRDCNKVDGTYSLDLGMLGCPSDTAQVIFFTDDKEYAEIHAAALEHGMCTVARGSVVRGEIWQSRAWWTYGDTRIFAVGTTAGGNLFYAGPAMLTEALEFYYSTKSDGSLKRISRNAARAIDSLRAQDGTDLGQRQRSRAQGDGAKARRRRQSANITLR